MKLFYTPMNEYITHCFEAAYHADFYYVFTLVARDTDAMEMYANLKGRWSLLDSNTRNHILLILAGKKHSTDIERRCSTLLGNEYHDSYSVGEYNDYITFIDQDKDLIYGRPGWMSSRRDSIQKELVSENPTDAINSLVEWFDIDKKSVPCIVVSQSCFSQSYSLCDYLNIKDIYVIPINYNDVFGYFKILFDQIAPAFSKISDYRKSLGILEARKKEIEKKLSSPLFNPDEKLAILQKELQSIAKEGVKDKEGLDLSYCIETLSYGVFEQPIRGKLNKYIDLVKKYEKRTGLRFSADDIIINEEQKLAERIQLEAEQISLPQEIDAIINKCHEQHVFVRGIFETHSMNRTTN